MYVPRGYRAREAAARLRNNRKLVSEEVRAARYQALPDNCVSNEVEVEVEVAVTEANSTPPETVETETEEKTAAKGKNKNKK